MAPIEGGPELPKSKKKRFEKNVEKFKNNGSLDTEE
jgi:hypothetical protein